MKLTAEEEAIFNRDYDELIARSPVEIRGILESHRQGYKELVERVMETLPKQGITIPITRPLNLPF